MAIVIVDQKAELEFFPCDAVDHHDFVGAGGKFVDKVFGGLSVAQEFEGVGGEAIGSGLGVRGDGAGGAVGDGTDGFDGEGAIGFEGVSSEGADAAEAGAGGVTTVEFGVGGVGGVDLLAGDVVDIQIAAGGRFEVSGPRLAFERGEIEFVAGEGVFAAFAGVFGAGEVHALGREFADGGVVEIAPVGEEIPVTGGQAAGEDLIFEIDAEAVEGLGLDVEGEGGESEGEESAVHARSVAHPVLWTQLCLRCDGLLKGVVATSNRKPPLRIDPVGFFGSSRTVRRAPAKLPMGSPFGRMVMARAAFAPGVIVARFTGSASCKIVPLISAGNPVLTIQPSS